MNYLTDKVQNIYDQIKQHSDKWKPVDTAMSEIQLFIHYIYRQVTTEKLQSLKY